MACLASVRHVLLELPSRTTVDCRESRGSWPASVLVFIGFVEGRGGLEKYESCSAMWSLCSLPFSQANPAKSLDAVQCSRIRTKRHRNMTKIHTCPHLIQFNQSESHASRQPAFQLSNFGYHFWYEARMA